VNHVYQLAIILYPADRFNEKILLKIRECIVKLPKEHVLKRWMEWVGRTQHLNPEEEKKRAFLFEIIQTQYNLITDSKVKDEIIRYLGEIDEGTVPESVLKSYLYLMLGNVSRSDNILRTLIMAPPRLNWEKAPRKESFFHQLSSSNFQLITSKLSRHPADRKIFQLFSRYIQNYYNDNNLIDILSESGTNEIDKSLSMGYVESLSPSLVKFLRLREIPDIIKFEQLRDQKSFPFDEQSYWLWAFSDIDPLISPLLVPELIRLEKEDQLWLIYLLGNERIADQYARQVGKSFLPSRRKFLKDSLSNPNSFMLALYKLIELGDISPDLVEQTLKHLSHE
jgi:hypothetical protein